MTTTTEFLSVNTEDDECKNRGAEISKRIGHEASPNIMTNFANNNLNNNVEDTLFAGDQNSSHETVSVRLESGVHDECEGTERDAAGGVSHGRNKEVHEFLRVAHGSAQYRGKEITKNGEDDAQGEGGDESVPHAVHVSLVQLGSLAVGENGHDGLRDGEHREETKVVDSSDRTGCSDGGDGTLIGCIIGRVVKDQTVGREVEDGDREGGAQTRDTNVHHRLHQAPWEMDLLEAHMNSGFLGEEVDESEEARDGIAEHCWDTCSNDIELQDANEDGVTNEVHDEATDHDARGEESRSFSSNERGTANTEEVKDHARADDDEVQLRWVEHVCVWRGAQKKEEVVGETVIENGADNADNQTHEEHVPDDGLGVVVVVLPEGLGVEGSWADADEQAGSKDETLDEWDTEGNRGEGGDPLGLRVSSHASDEHGIDDGVEGLCELFNQIRIS